MTAANRALILGEAAARRGAVLFGVVLLVLAAFSDAAGADDARADPTPAAEASVDPTEQARPGPVLTAKERLGGKAKDEQRLNDCKVPEPVRTRPRPTCPAPDAGAAARP